MPCSELDELEAYMQRVQSSSSRRSDRIRLKTQLMELRRDEARLLKQLGLPLASRARRRQSASSVPSSFSAADALRAARGSLRTEENSSELMSCEQNELDKFDLHQTASSLDPSNPLEHEDDSNTRGVGGT
ncbi:unnamed protein product [Protopolystoma xenopodis]|uniref:Uncharacterized protein n=1 Tax=Protopolystoma xenopodis TaxID=117903 RepID=A0A448WMP5_9PLAT|nr:unnamed protein product [Protopolystoma xenopodis]